MKNIIKSNYLKNIIRSDDFRWIALTFLGIAGIITIAAVKAAGAPSIPAINLASSPLYAASTGDKPVIALALSVEYPTVGAQYLDATYSNTNEYLGYYDAESCYTYNNAPTETPATGLNTVDYKRFDRSDAATNRTCTNAFSGNFLNWSSNSAIDMLRVALSGGDRYIDENGLTILQRAMIPNGDPICMWNSSNFPSKQLPKGSNSDYLGAIPTAMRTQANGNTVYVANTLNRIYFGLNATGSCGDTSSYTLGGPTGASIGPVVNKNQSLPSDASAVCAAENGTCSFSGIKEVWYGANNRWAVAPVANSVVCSNGNFGDPINGTVKNCYTRPYSGTWQQTGGSLNSDGFFYARVQVCNKDNIGQLLDTRELVKDRLYCTQYPNGNFKPTGSIQKYSDQLRLAAFGYLMDQTTNRVGGVLRAPMKYVGDKTFDINGSENTPTTGNPNAEWDPNTGIYTSNPDNDNTQTKPISGVINYLNKFGRTGPVAGRYKIYDPVGELHYETLRYLQGLPPTAAAISNITTAMYDGYPAYTTWNDPYGGGRSNTADYSCQKSNIVMIGDVNSHDQSNIPATNISDNIPNISGWRSIVQNFESNASVNYVDGQGDTRTTGNPNTSNSGTPSNQIIGSAYWAHTHDIRGTDWTNGVSKQRPGLRIKSFLFDVNEYGNSNDASYRRNRNQFFMAAKYGGFESTDANSKPYNNYGNPFKDKDGVNNNKVWEKSDVANEAGTYYLQSSAKEVLLAFEDIFNRTSSALNNIAGNSVSSKIVTAEGSLVYQGAFDTTDWSGKVSAYPASVASGVITVGTTATWEAAARLATLSAPATSRNIVIGNNGASSNPVASDFLWDELQVTNQSALRKLTPNSTADSETVGRNRLNYLRGDKTNEGSSFRSRKSLLGDIINSGIIYSGKPTSGIFYSSTYTTFATNNKNRTPAVFVGANDGMLHAFNANTGDELFSYIPSWMAPKLAALTSTTYQTNHQTYVDSTPVVAEAMVGSSGSATDWRTVLVSGTGGGGSGVFALDVTNPAAFTKSNVIWEFTRADDLDMGFVVGKPKIMRLRTSASTATTATYRWFALVASGVNNYVSENGLYSTEGKPALFLLALDKAAGEKWTAGSNYYKISIPTDSTLQATNPTGLINFETTYGNVGELKLIFMGDLHGNLWKLNFSQYGTSDWTMNKLSYFKNGNSDPIPMYSAKNAAGAIQPISMAPSVKAGPLVSGVETNYIIFGTGKYLESSDKSSTLQNSVYAVFDNGNTTADRSNATTTIEGRGRLIAGSVVVSTGIVSVPEFTWGRAQTAADTTQRSGWYFDFPVSGERQVSNGFFTGNILTSSSLIPDGTGSSASCKSGGGNSATYYIDITTGDGSRTISTVGMTGPGFGLDQEISNSKISKTTGRRESTRTVTTFAPGTKGIGTPTTVSSTTIKGRMSWRQINNYQDLKN
nr:PilC/PilY family type IV pilus protein [uncultured Albidiferax sp.]